MCSKLANYTYRIWYRIESYGIASLKIFQNFIIWLLLKSFYKTIKLVFACNHSKNMIFFSDFWWIEQLYISETSGRSWTNRTIAPMESLPTPDVINFYTGRIFRHFCHRFHIHRLCAISEQWSETIAHRCRFCIFFGLILIRSFTSSSLSFLWNNCTFIMGNFF